MKKKYDVTKAASCTRHDQRAGGLDVLRFISVRGKLRGVVPRERNSILLPLLPSCCVLLHSTVAAAALNYRKTDSGK